MTYALPTSDQTQDHLDATSILHGSAPNSPKSDIDCTQVCTAILPDTDDTVNNSGLLRFANLEASHRVVLCTMKMPVSIPVPV